MHPNPAFRKETRGQNVKFARERAFGILAVNADNGPLVSHIPFQLNEAGTIAELHLVRSNPMVKLLTEPQSAVIAVSGGDAYISPDWYDISDQVPTWNYVAVHLRGTLSLLPQDELHGVLTRLSTDMENRLLPKRPWTSDKMDQEAYTRMQRQIVPARFDVTEINGTWKLSQNKSEKARLGAADGVTTSGIGQEMLSIADLMKRIKAD